jgi:hypothetical protein
MACPTRRKGSDNWYYRRTIPADIRVTLEILRCLIDAARKIQHQIQGDDHDFHCVVFVRNDVYQLLVEASSD